MNTEIQEQMRLLNVSISRIRGLYGRWAQKQDMNTCTLNIFYMLITVGPITQKQFCEAFDVPKQSVNKIITSLKNDGIISLLPCEEDKREKLVVLTEEGRKYILEVLTPLFAIESAVVERMGETLVEQFVKAATAFGDYTELEMKKDDVTNPITKYMVDGE